MDKDNGAVYKAYLMEEMGCRRCRFMRLEIMSENRRMIPRLRGPLRWAFFCWKSENVVGAKYRSSARELQAKCPNGQISAIGADPKCFGKQQSGNYA